MISSNVRSKQSLQKKASVTYNLFLTEVKWPPPLANFFVCANTAQFIIYTIELVLPSLITYYTKINVTIANTIRIGLLFFLSSLKLILVFQINRSYVITNSSTIQHFFMFVDCWRLALTMLLCTITCSRHILLRGKSSTRYLHIYTFKSIDFQTDFQT